MILLRSERIPWLGVFMVLPPALLFTYILFGHALYQIGWLSYVPWIADDSFSKSLPFKEGCLIFFLDYLFLGSLSIYNKIYYDPKNHRLWRHGVAFFIPYMKYISLKTVTAVIISESQHPRSRGYRIYLAKEDKGQEFIHCIGTKEESLDFIRKLSQITGAPIVEEKS